MADKIAKYTIVGGGLAAGSAIQELVAAGVAGEEILLIGAEAELPYSRPPLSKGFLAGNEERTSVFVEPAAFYETHRIGRRLQTKVIGIDTENNQLTLEDGETIPYQQLLLATGSRSRHITFAGDDLRGIFYLRTLADSEAIKAAAKPGARAVIIGGGFIGLEVAATLRVLGLEVTVLSKDAHLFSKFAVPELSGFFEELFHSQGVKVQPGVSLDHARGENDVLQTVVTSGGDELPADLLILGVGAEPNIEYLQGSSLTLDNGVIVDDELEAVVPGIFAAGDIANFPDVIFDNARRRIEHWDHAIETGKTAARNMLGRHETFKHVSYFFSDLFDVSFDMFGMTELASNHHFVGSVADKTAAVWYLKGSRLVAYFALGRSDEEKQQAQDWITTKASVDSTYLPNK